jgi:hypothetical protein
MWLTKSQDQREPTDRRDQRESSPRPSERQTPARKYSEFLDQLSAAIKKTDHSDIKRLLAVKPCDFDIDAFDSLGQVALSLAADRGDEITVKLLLANGSVPTRKNVSGKRAIDYAKNDKIRELLRQPPAIETQVKTHLSTDGRDDKFSTHWPSVDVRTKDLCQKSSAFVMKYQDGKKQRYFEVTVYDLIYNETEARAVHASRGKAQNSSKDHRNHKESSAKGQGWAWIHIPSNNVSREV